VRDDGTGFAPAADGHGANGAGAARQLEVDDRTAAVVAALERGGIALPRRAR
jgi:hypothetical protein